jgi:hypothetical protein
VRGQIKHALRGLQLLEHAAAGRVSIQHALIAPCDRVRGWLAARIQ